MRTYPIPFNEEARLRAVFDIPGLTAQNEALFDTICEAARTLLDCPIAHISVVEEDSQWYKSVVGMHLDPMPKDTGFCAHTIMSDAPMIVPDLSKDARFERHPMVAKGGPEARYYAGVPLILSSGHRFGSPARRHRRLPLPADARGLRRRLSRSCRVRKRNSLAGFSAPPPAWHHAQ